MTHNEPSKFLQDVVKSKQETQDLVNKFKTSFGVDGDSSSSSSSRGSNLRSSSRGRGSAATQSSGPIVDFKHKLNSDYCNYRQDKKNVIVKKMVALQKIDKSEFESYLQDESAALLKLQSAYEVRQKKVNITKRKNKIAGSNQSLLAKLWFWWMKKQNPQFYSSSNLVSSHVIEFFDSEIKLAYQRLMPLINYITDKIFNNNFFSNNSITGLKIRHYNLFRYFSQEKIGDAIQDIQLDGMNKNNLKAKLSALDNFLAIYFFLSKNQQDLLEVYNALKAVHENNSGLNEHSTKLLSFNADRFTILFEDYKLFLDEPNKSGFSIENCALACYNCLFHRIINRSDLIEYIGNDEYAVAEDIKNLSSVGKQVKNKILLDLQGVKKKIEMRTNMQNVFQADIDFAHAIFHHEINTKQIVHFNLINHATHFILYLKEFIVLFLFLFEELLIGIKGIEILVNGKTEHQNLFKYVKQAEEPALNDLPNISIRRDILATFIRHPYQDDTGELWHEIFGAQSNLLKQHQSLMSEVQKNTGSKAVQLIKIFQKEINATAAQSPERLYLSIKDNKITNKLEDYYMVSYKSINVNAHPVLSLKSKSGQTVKMQANSLYGLLALGKAMSVYLAYCLQDSAIVSHMATANKDSTNSLNNLSAIEELYSF